MAEIGRSMSEAIGLVVTALYDFSGLVREGLFPVQPSQKDGRGRMCKTHWNQYTNALRKAALARKAAEGGAAAQGASTELEPVEVPVPVRAPGKRNRKADVPEAGSQGDAG